MAVTQQLLSLDAYFRDTEGPKIIVNDLDYYVVSDIDLVSKNLLTVYEQDVFDTVPSCDCKHLKGNYNINKTCPECGTVCKEAFSKTQPLLWLKTMYDNIKFMNPMFYLMYRDVFKGKTDYVRWMSDPSYNPPTRLPSYITGVKEIIKERSYFAMVNNIENVLLFLLNHSAFKTPDKQTYITNLLDLYRTNKDLIFSTYFPIINKKIFVMEKTSMGNFTNITVAEIIDTVMLWVKYTSDEDLTEKKAARAMVNALHKMSNMLNNYFNTYLYKKAGIFRKHVYGARIPFSFRSVIVSISGPHDYDEIHIPWSIGVTLFRPHIINKLINKHKVTYKDANIMLWRAVKKFDPLINDILNELIAESPYYTELSHKQGIPIMLNRNPSLLAHSSNIKYITEFKIDPEDKTLSTSFLSIKAPNGDFDGDELNGYLIGDKFIYDEFAPFKSHLCIPELSKPYAISGNMTLFAPSNNILTNAVKDMSSKGDDSAFIKQLS